MNQKSLIIGIITTIVWFVGIYLFCSINEFSFSNKDLNSLGDFLAGIFAPVAFFWLIYGYIQQGRQLEQNTKALEQQERALQLQIEEMKESVKQQKELVEVQKGQYEAANISVEPVFSFSELKIHCFGIPYTNGNYGEPDYELIFKLKNVGHEIRNLKCSNYKNDLFSSLERVVNEEIELNLPLSDLELAWEMDCLTSKINIRFQNIYGRPQTWIYFLKLSYFDNNNYKIDNPLRISMDLIEKSSLT